MKKIFLSIFKNTLYLMLYATAVLLVFGAGSYLWIRAGFVYDFFMRRLVLSAAHLLLPIIAVCFAISLRWKYPFRKSCARAAASVAVYAVLMVAAIACFKGYFTSFTTEKWQRLYNDRYLMLDDLNRDHHLKDLSRDEIIALLGTPDHPYDGTEDENIIDYHVASFYIDPTMLSFEFENDMVKDVYTYTEFRSSRQELE